MTSAVDCKQKGFYLRPMTANTIVKSMVVGGLCVCVCVCGGGGGGRGEGHNNFIVVKFCSYFACTSTL